MRTALVHDWLTGMRGGEKVLEVFCELYPDADIFTLVHVPGKLSPAIERHRIVTSFIQKLPAAETRYRHYLPLMPAAVRRFDLSGYDLVLSSSHCVAKGVRVPEGALHICYCHTPMRYIWDQYEEYFGPGRAGWAVRAAMGLLRGPLQRWDAATAAGVDHFIANSRNVAERIRRHYGRESAVLFGPVELDKFRLSRRDDGFYLIVSALVPYKRVDVAVRAFNELDRPLKVIGSGPELERLKRDASKNIEFLGWRSTEELAEAYASCRALIFPGEEDFGIVPLEAMACGKPVIALGRGGALETVAPPGGGADPTGLFFDSPDVAPLKRAVEEFERDRARFVPEKIRAHAAPFDRARFKEKIAAFVRDRLDEFKRGAPR